MDAQSLLASVSQTPINELENFVRELNALIIRKKTDDKEYRDRALLSKINRAVLTKNKAERYVMLHLKLEAETITDLEYQEFMDLVAQDENLRNERVKYLIELAQLRNISLPDLMQHLGLNTFSYG